MTRASLVEARPFRSSAWPWSQEQLATMGRVPGRGIVRPRARLRSDWPAPGRGAGARLALLALDLLWYAYHRAAHTFFPAVAGARRPPRPHSQLYVPDAPGLPSVRRAGLALRDLRGWSSCRPGVGKDAAFLAIAVLGTPANGEPRQQRPAHRLAQLRAHRHGDAPGTTNAARGTRQLRLGPSRSGTSCSARSSTNPGASQESAGPRGSRRVSPTRAGSAALAGLGRCRAGPRRGSRV